MGLEPTKVNSRLVDEDLTQNLIEVLDQMELLEDRLRDDVSRTWLQ